MLKDLYQQAEWPPEPYQPHLNRQSAKRKRVDFDDENDDDRNEGEGKMEDERNEEDDAENGWAPL